MAEPVRDARRESVYLHQRVLTAPLMALAAARPRRAQRFRMRRGAVVDKFQNRRPALAHAEQPGSGGGRGPVSTGLALVLKEPPPTTTTTAAATAAAAGAPTTTASAVFIATSLDDSPKNGGK